MPVFVVDAQRQPLAPCHPAVARRLLAAGKAALLRRHPFTIILKRAVPVVGVPPLRLKIDPGSRVTGLVVIDDRTGEVVFAAELHHRGRQIKAALDERRAFRRNRRSRKTRYRKARFDNRQRRDARLPPSIESRIANIETWSGRLRRYAPITAISTELAKFDTHAFVNPDVAGVQYQQGVLAGYEVREYLLEKWHRRCAYCGVEKVPLQVEHIQATSQGGTGRVSNLCLACAKCNQEKGNRPIEEFLARKSEMLERLLAQAQTPLKDAAAVNAARWELFRRLERTGLPVEVGTGSQTKFNRSCRSLPKAHWLDAACVGMSTPRRLGVEGISPLVVEATGHGRRRRCLPDQFGFPRGHAARQKAHFGFRTGDQVRAVVPKGKHAGTIEGRVAVRKSGSFLVGKSDGIRWRHCRLLQKADGYGYGRKEASAHMPIAEATGLDADET